MGCGHMIGRMFREAAFETSKGQHNAMFFLGDMI